MNNFYKKNITYFLIVFGFALLIMLNNCSFIERERPFSWSEALASHKVVKSDKQLKELWSRPNIFIRNDNVGFLVTAAKEKIFLLGSIREDEIGGVLAIDGSSGELIWQDDSGFGSAIYATSSTLYVSMLNNNKGVRAYDVNTGQLLWKTIPEGIRNVSRLYVFDNIIHVNGNNDTFSLLQADTGEEIWGSSYDFGNDIYLRTDQVTFRRLGTSLLAMDTKSQAIMWEANINRLYYQGPFFTDDTIFIRTARDGLGRVYAIDRHNGEVLWYTEKNIASNNIAVTNNVVYLLTEQGSLLGLDARNGDIIASVEFQPKPFLLRDSIGHVGYYVAVDEAAALLYAILGDSRQLFAFKIE